MGSSNLKRLFNAAMEDDVDDIEAVVSLSDGVDPNVRDNDGNTPGTLPNNKATPRPRPCWNDAR